MTARHLIIGVMQRINARCHLHLSTPLGLDPATVFRLYHGENDGVRMRTIDQIQQRSKVPFDDLFAWYRQPAEPIDCAPKAPRARKERQPRVPVDYTELDAALLAAIDAGRCTMPQLDSDSALLALVAPLQGKRPAWRVIDYRLQVLRKRGELTYAGKVWARAGKYGSN